MKRLLVLGAPDPEEEIPELPDTTARENIPFLDSQIDSDGRVVIQEVGPEFIQKFLDGKIRPELID